MGHNSAQAEFHDQSQPVHLQLSGSQKKTAYALRVNAGRMISAAGIERVVFVTFTIGERDAAGFWQKVYDPKEASALWNKLNRREVGRWFEKLILVTERHRDGGIHFHGLATVHPRFGDVRTGFDFAAVRRGDYSSAPEGLLKLWREMRDTLPEFGFGRAQAEPVKSNGEAVAAYVAKYIEKNLFNRPAADKRSKLVRYIGWNKEQLKPNEFSWATPRACAWRLNAAALAGLAGVSHRGEASQAFGPRWAYRLSRVMNAVAGNDQKECRDELRESWPVSQSARRLVMREARSQWVSRQRAIESSEASRGPWQWHYRTPTERAQKDFAEVEEWNTKQPPMLAGTWKEDT